MANYTTKKITTSATIGGVGTPVAIHGVTLIAGTAAGSIIIKNGESTGTEMWKLTWAAVTNAGDASTAITFTRPIICGTSGYATLAGTAAIAYVQYSTDLAEANRDIK